MKKDVVSVKPVESLDPEPRISSDAVILVQAALQGQGARILKLLINVLSHM